MTLNLPGLKERSTDDNESEPNTTPTDDQAAISALTREPGELIIQMLQRRMMPTPVADLPPVFRQIVEEQNILSAKHLELLARMKENPANEASTSVLKRLKLQFRNKISLPVFTGKRLVGENNTTIEIALVDALTEQIINIGTESTATLEIVGFRVGDKGSIDDSWTNEDFRRMIMSEKKGKRILQGDTCLQLKEGVCSATKISFTHNSEYKRNGFYRLGAGVVDDYLMNRVEVARTEAFLMKDRRTTYTEKRPHPRLSDGVRHLQQISSKGERYRRLKKAEVMTVENLLTLFYTDPNQLEDILQLKASSNSWKDIVNNAQASSGMFLWLDPSNQRKSGVVLNAKLQLKGLVAEPFKYLPVDQLSAEQKQVSNNGLLKFASEHFEELRSFEDETSLKEYLITCTPFKFNSLPSANQSVGTSNVIDEPATPSALVSAETFDKLDESNLHIGQQTAHTDTATSTYEQVEETVPFYSEMNYSMNSLQEDMLSHLQDLESPNWQHGYNPTEPGTSFQAVMLPRNTCGHTEYDVGGACMECIFNHIDVIARARTRWSKVKLLMNMISFIDGILALRRQRWCRYDYHYPVYDSRCCHDASK